MAVPKSSKRVVHKVSRSWGAIHWVWAHAHWIFPFAAVAVLLEGQIQVLVPFLLPNGDNTHHMMSGFVLQNSYSVGDAIWGPQSFDYGMPLLRFYQPLFYLTSLGLGILTDANPMFLQNFIVTVFFSASPLSLCYGLRKIGLPRFAAGIASLMAMTSVAGFGNSIEAFHCNGIVTQSMAAFFFPLFLGTFAGFLRKENRLWSTSVLFALTFLSHVVMAVLAVLAGALYFFTTPFSIRRIWKRVAAFGGVVFCLVAFWLLPFLAHTVEFRPIPDSEVRVEKRWWFVGASDDELAHLVASGRLFDDARTDKFTERDDADKLIDTLNIAITRRVRPPVITGLVAWGLLVSLFLLRRPGVRFVVAGFLFSLLLIAGQDDHPWLRFVPFINYVQSFRCVYLVEFFAFALIGLGIERPLFGLFCAARRSHVVLRVATAGIALCAVIVPSKWAVGEMHELQAALIRTWDPEPLDAALSNLAPIPNGGYPFRTDVTEVGGMMRDWLSINGHRMGITHWGKSGPNGPFKAQAYLTEHRSNIAFSRLLGQRFLYSDKQTAERLGAGKSGGESWRPVRFEFQTPESRSSRNLFLDSGQGDFLQPMANRLVAVVCRNNQWIWLIDAWMARYGETFENRDTPFPVRVRDTSWRETSLFPLVDTVLYLDGAAAQRDAQVIEKLASEGKTVFAPYEIAGASAVREIPRDTPVWAVLEDGAGRGSKSRVSEDDDEGGDEGAGLAAVTAQFRKPKRLTSQRYSFDVQAMEPSLAVLPTVDVPGWSATLDGEPIDVFTAGPSFASVALPEGEHRLVFSWRMPLFDRLVAALSLAMFALLGCLWLLSAMGDIAFGRSLGSTLRGYGSR